MTLPPRPTILCIEDEEDLRADLADELEGAGYRVYQAATGTEALEFLDRQRPDLVLCDITMPGLGGYELLEEMRSRGGLADVPFIFLTALAERNDLLRGKQAGADDYLVKPVDYDLLLATVSTRLGQVDRVRAGAVERAEESWREILDASRGRALDALRKAATAFDRFLVGAIILDRDGRLRLMNSEAQRILDLNDGLSLVDGRLESAVPAPMARLQSCLDEAFGGGCTDEIIPVPRLSGRRPFILLVPGQQAHPGDDPDALVLLLVDTEQRTRTSADTLVRLYNLTPTETRVALLLMDGKRLDQIAEELEVAQTTIVFHLKNLFRKTETHRQADLVRVLLSVPLRTSAS